ncbi:MAG: Coenzyme F420 hydrogenase/dehydrogenase, beta subunit C-terminal domain [Kiritimatiellae bacterium]|nr:Coenzyme F420 hydrogenase/dehydrogenase, beta subunit C-terminal domain [Kiritimatiellia bacterium]
MPADRQQAGAPYEPVEGILQIVRDGLCHRCGACVGFCPAGTFGLDQDGYPIKVADCTRCGLCVRICSGAAVDYQAIGAGMFGPGYRYGSPLGQLRTTHVAHAADAAVRWAGTSGGVVTQLLVHLLATGRIKGAVVAIQDPDDPTRGKGFIARTREELIEAARSRYTTTPSLAVLREIAPDDGPCAVVGVPCQVHAIRAAQMISRTWRDRLPLVIGLYCHFNPPCLATREIISTLAPGKTLQDIVYRHKGHRGWPEDTVFATFTDGSTWLSPHGPAESVTVLGMLYPLGRCLLCLDAAAEFADISVGDPWIRAETGDWKYSAREGWSGVIVRTEPGARAFSEAVAQGVLEELPVTPEEIVDGQYPMIREKKLDVPFRLAARKALRLPVPAYGADLPRITLKRAWRGVHFFASRLIPVCPPLRRLLARFIFSPLGAKLVKLRAAQKKRTAARRLQQGLRQTLPT